ncbi:hypothetical protein SAMN05216552_103351 [Pseudoduganella namucuonensis]|uniref:Transporter n=2 Tax=Pseudoduganella namucuonensis TaxID=1035707 RepID=A0A1I7LNA0_9BURK|nr:hypothetical protein SAMN05216552_103351 [Pseudoduganella namucuonensis]
MLAERDQTILELRQRIASLERDATPHRVKHQQPPAPAEDELDSNRALERALVRERGLLLSPRTYEIEPNFIYSHSDNNAGFRRDSYGPGVTVRAGLPWRSQVELTLPYVIERLNIDAVRSHSRGRGDFNLGLSHQLRIERGWWPGIIGSLGYQGATGRSTAFEPVRLIARGSGFKSLQGALTAIKRVDPLVFFGSYAYTHVYSATKSGIKVEPGNVHGLRFGTALAAGPTTSLRAAFNVNFLGRTKYGGERLQNDDPTAFLEFGGSAVLTESTAIDVIVGAGLTRNTPDFRITISLPIRF